jgi:hypothetical protein
MDLKRIPSSEAEVTLRDLKLSEDAGKELWINNRWCLEIWWNMI